MTDLNLENIRPLQDEIANHAVYSDLRSLADLRIFMSHHVYSVWDFMSLIKYLQNRITPAGIPWVPRGDPALRRFINHLVLDEESGQAPGADGQPVFGSHLELYLRAMDEIGVDSGRFHRFLEHVVEEGPMNALDSVLVPEPSRRFSETTFCIINEDKPHLAAASLILGREGIFPDMFRRLRQGIEVTEDQAPAFHHYLISHIHEGEASRDPISMQLLETLCGDDEGKHQEAEAAAEEALCARLRFWDGIHEAIKNANA